MTTPFQGLIIQGKQSCLDGANRKNLLLQHKQDKKEEYLSGPSNQSTSEKIKLYTSIYLV